jgi:hypothetical protein
MDEKKRGQYLRLSLPRKLICDVMHYARQVPSLPVQKQMCLAELVRVRRLWETRPSWVGIFAKAFALVARECPRLRQSYIRFPTPRLYEHPHSVASVALSREYDGEEAIFFVQLREPEVQSIAVLDGRLRAYKNRPLAEISSMREAIRFTGLPLPLRRLAWWYALNVSGPRRVRRFGTFGVSAYSRLGVDSLHPLSPLTAVLNYGPIGPDGKVSVRIIYDHRVLDGMVVGRALCRLEEVLNDAVARELATGSGSGPTLAEAA